MARIVAPNKEYAGVSAGVSFYRGEAHTDDAYLIEWFRTHGYEVEEPARTPLAEADPGTPETETAPGTGDILELPAPGEPPIEIAPAQRGGRKKQEK